MKIIKRRNLSGLSVRLYYDKEKWVVVIWRNRSFVYMKEFTNGKEANICFRNLGYYINQFLESNSNHAIEFGIEKIKKLNEIKGD